MAQSANHTQASPVPSASVTASSNAEPVQPSDTPLPGGKDGNDALKNQKDVLWGLYQEHRNHARHQETLRSTITNIIVVASSALVGLAVNSGGRFEGSDWPLTISVLFLGLVGALFCTAHSVSYGKYKARAYFYRDALSVLLFEEEPEKLSEMQDEADEKGIRLWSRWLQLLASAHHLWIGFPVVVAVAGLLLTAVAIW